MNYLAKEGLVGKVISSHVGMGRLFGKMCSENRFPVFALPLGIYNHVLETGSSKDIGYLSHVGLKTTSDPRIDACCQNEMAKKEKPIVELLNLNQQETLLYHSLFLNVAFIKASFADKEGNVSLKNEPIIGEQLLLACNAHNNGGIVIVEVEQIVPHIKAKDVLINQKLVDYVILRKTSPKDLKNEYNIPVYRPELTGEKMIQLSSIKKIPLDIKKLCALRAFQELKKGDVINLGIGMPEYVANVINEKKMINDFNLSVETGHFGGVPSKGIIFGININPVSIISTLNTFLLYDGGFLDAAVLGMGEVDCEGNVNVSNFGNRLTGPGGFINITQNTKLVIFLGTFAVGAKEEIIDHQLKIIEEGKTTKFVKKVNQITFSGKEAIINNQKVLYITERGLFELTDDGLELKEIVKGIDLEKDILAKMAFRPIIKDIKYYQDDLFN